MNAAVSPPDAQLTHLGLFVRDLERMAGFYTRVLGLVQTDAGVLRGRRLAFLSRDPKEHHQIVLAEGRTDDGAEVINQISFRVDDLAALKRFNALLVGEGVADLQTVTHGNAWSIYFRDPEGNRIELYTDSEWYVAQPMRVAIDLTADEAAIRTETRALIAGDPSFKPISDWSADFEARLQGGGVVTITPSSKETAMTGETAQPKLLAEAPARLHHYAYTVRDQEVNRRFMEDVLGIPLVATWCERTFRAEVGREVDYCHTFYEIGDGGAVAFFQWDDEEVYQQNKTGKSASGPHLALKATKKTQDEIEARLKAAEVPYRKTDHGYCLSLYVHTPDGLRLEFAVDVAGWEAIAAMRRKDSHQELKRWMGGDHHTNNDDRPH